MKNKSTLLIASILLALCVLLKEASHQAAENGNKYKLQHPGQLSGNGPLNEVP